MLTTPLRNRTYRHLYLAQLVALLGTGLATVALGLLAYGLAGENAGQVLGTALAIKMLAYVLVAPVANALVARLPRRAVLVAADVLRVAVALCLPFVAEVWQIYVLIFVLQTASATFTPTFQSVIPDVLEDEDDYTSALSLSRLAYDLESVLSPALAAALLTLVSSSTLFLGTAFGFAASAVLVVSVTIPRGIFAEADPTPFLVRARRGTALLFSHPSLRPILLLNLAVAAAGAFVIVQTVVIVRSVFDLPEPWVAWALGANGLGSMVAAFLLPRILRRARERTVMLTGATALTCAAGLTPFALSATRMTGLAALLVLWLLIGLGWACVETPVGRIIRRSVDRADLSSAFAAQFSLQHACWLITYPLAGWLGAFSLTGSVVVLTVVAGGAVAGAWLLWPRTSLVPDSVTA